MRSRCAEHGAQASSCPITVAATRHDGDDRRRHRRRSPPALAGKAEVYVDGGIRRGTDILKALALGARAVLIGRPVIWGLTVERRGRRARCARAFPHRTRARHAAQRHARLADLSRSTGAQEPAAD